MKIMRILGVVVMAATVAGCNLTEKQFVELRTVMNQRPALRAEFQRRCVNDFRREPKAEIEVIAELLDIKASTFPQTFCKRVMTTYLSGRLTYADYQAGIRKKPTPRLIRILRGK